MNFNEKNNPNNIQRGDAVIANYGAMYPTVEGIVSKCGYDTAHLLFSDGTVRVVSYDEIRMPGETSVNGSPIGITLIDA